MGEDESLKCFAFIECLPSAERDRAKYFVIHEQVTFDELVLRYNQDTQGLVPRWALEKKWRNCMPISRGILICADGVLSGTS